MHRNINYSKSRVFISASAHGERCPHLQVRTGRSLSVPTVLQALCPLQWARRADARLQPAWQMFLYPIHVFGEEEESPARWRTPIWAETSPLVACIAPQQRGKTASLRFVQIKGGCAFFTLLQTRHLIKERVHRIRVTWITEAPRGPKGAATWMWRQQRCHISPPRVNGIMSHLL